MEQTEVEKLIGELETALDRLRSLYEQYFVGIERIEPGVARKDVERRLYVLRREQIRNTALRYRFQMVLQRFNTYQTHWLRICREIENGTYKRHLLRAQRRFGSSRPPRGRASVAPPPVHPELEAPLGSDVAAPLASVDPEPSPDSFEVDVSLDDGESPSSGPSAFRPAMAPAAAPAAILSVAEPTSLVPRPGPAAPRIGVAAASPPVWKKVGTPAAPAGPRPAVAAGPVPAASSAGAVGARPAPAPPAAGALSARPPVAPPATGARPPPPAPPAPTVRLAPDAASAARPAPAPPAPTARLAPDAASAARPAPALPAPTTRLAPDAAPAARPAPAPPAPAARLAPPDAASAARPAPAPPAPAARPAPPSPQTTAPTPPSAAPSRAAALPVPPLAIPPRPLPPRPSPSVAPRPPAADSSDLSEKRLRQIYVEYVDTKRRQNESTATLSYQAVAKSLRESEDRLRQKHGKPVDFEVGLKDGKTVLRPVLK